MRSLLAALAVLAAAPCSAAWRDVDASRFELAPPPAAGSAADKQDMAQILDWQQKRTPLQCSQAASMTTPDFHSLWDGSGLFTAEELARAEPFVDDVSKAASGVSSVFKKRFARPRPYNEDSRVVPCADKPKGNASYPSFHATAGAVDACALALIFPDRAEKIRAWGAYVGELRVIGGVHHPTDVEAGRTLGAALCAWLSAQDDFNADAAAVRAAPAAAP